MRVTLGRGSLVRHAYWAEVADVTEAGSSGTLDGSEGDVMVDRTDDRLAELLRDTDEAADAYMRGQITLEHVETHAWDDTAVLVMIERQHGDVGGTPDQDWCLRVSHVYRHDGERWLLVHRHADPLVRPIDMTVLGATARGEVPTA
jgi:hypothetical protein